MRCGRLRLPAVAAAAALPTLLAGLLVAPSPAFLVGPDDSTVRTVNVPPPPALALSTDEALGLDGAHPPTDPVPRLQDAAVHQTPGADDSRAVPVRVSGTALPARVLIAYRRAADALAQSDPGCHLAWSLVAGIGKVESGHAAGGALDRAGRTLSPILGPVLDGAGAFAAIPDSDGGRWDGDTTWDRAVGPMQFIPSSWSVWGRDGDGDGEANPSDIDDAALATASYLCAGDRDLRDEKDRRSAVFSYNHSWDYVDLVLAWADAYATGAPVQTGTLVALDGPVEALPPHGRPAGTAGSATAAGAPTAPASGPVAAPATAEPQAPASAAPTESGPVATEAPAATPEPAQSSSPPPSAEPSPGPTTSAPPPCPTETATASPTPTGTADPTPTPTETATPTPTPSPTGTDPSPTSTASPTPTGCPTPSP